MTLTKSSIKKADLVALLENLKSRRWLPIHLFNILEAIRAPKADMIIILDVSTGNFMEKPYLHDFDFCDIYRLKPGTTLKQLRDACFPKPEKVEPRFLEYDINPMHGTWVYDNGIHNNYKAIEAMNRTDFAGLKYDDDCWYMIRQFRMRTCQYTCVTDRDTVTIPMPSKIRFINPKFKEQSK